MPIDPANGGLSAAQASLVAQMMEMQSQGAAVNALMSDGSAATNSSNASDSFSALLSAALGNSTNPLTALAGSTGLSSAQLSGILGQNGVPTATGNQSIANAATDLASHLTGPNKRSFDASTPAAVQQLWNSGWGANNVQCVAFVDGAMRQAGITLPAVPNATNFWSAYAGQAGWTEIANGQGLPQPGDILAMSGGSSGLGHVAVVTAVVPPTNGQPGRVIFAQANSGSAQGELTINASGQIQAWPGYVVQGMIRAN